MTAPRTVEGWFGVGLAVVLAGYLFFGRPFAYVGVPTLYLFIGEAVLVLGVVVGLRYGRVVAPRLLGRFGTEALAALVVLAIVRLAVDLPAHGVLALRDGALVLYSMLAAMVVAALLARPRLLPWLLAWYRRVLPWFLVWAPVAVVANRLAGDAAPSMPGTDVGMLAFKPGDLAVHTAIGLAFLWLVETPETEPARRRRHLLTAVGVVGLLVAASQNRGGLLAAGTVLVLVLAASGARRALLGAVATTVAVVFAFALVADVRIDTPEREVSAAQLIENLTALVGGSEGDTDDGLEGTVDWRLAYWGQVVGDVLSGQHGSWGAGFGPNLADQYGYQVAKEDAQTRLRNVHNSHLTLLARLGVVAAVLWILFWTLWLTALWGAGRDEAGTSSGRLASWVTAAVAGILVNAVFDPALEGPQMALWLWTLVGVGCALYQPEVRASLDHPTETRTRGEGDGDGPARVRPSSHERAGRGVPA